MSKKDKTEPLGKKSAAKKANEPLMDIAQLAAKEGTPSWMMAALQRMTGWEDGKQVTKTQFENALDALAKRPLGGGR